MARDARGPTIRAVNLLALQIDAPGVAPPIPTVNAATVTTVRAASVGATVIAASITAVCADGHAGTVHAHLPRAVRI